MNRERNSSQITQSQARWRKGFRVAMSTVSCLPQTRILHQEVAGDTDGVEKAIKLLSQGYGMIGVVPHRSFRDFLESMNFVFRREGINDRRIDIPFAKHQYDNLFFNLSARMFKATINVTQHPVVTERTKKRLSEKFTKESMAGKIIGFAGPIKTPNAARELKAKKILRSDKYLQAKEKLENQERSLLANFTNEACETLAIGGWVFIAPQATRSPELKLSKRTLGTLLASAIKKGVDPEKIALFFLGHEVKGEEKANYKPSSGFNRGKTFIMRPGPCFTLAQALEASGGLKTLDAWAVEKVLAKLVSPHYLSEEIRRQLYS